MASPSTLGTPTKPGGSRPLGLGLALIGAGLVWASWSVGVEVPWERVAPIALIVVGVLLLIVPRRDVDDGLVVVGVVLAVIAVLGTVLPVPAAVSAGERSYEVHDVGELESSYALGAGELTLDLRGLELTDAVTPVRVGLAMGELVVLVPEGVSVTGEASVAMGEVVAFDRTRSGIAQSVVLAENDPGDAPVLALELSVGLGSLEVTR